MVWRRTSITGEGALYEVAYEEASRALSEQLSLIDSFRTRAGLLLSAAAITTSVLGAQALDHGPIGYAAWAALVSFFAVAIISLVILRQREWALTRLRSSRAASRATVPDRLPIFVGP